MRSSLILLVALFAACGGGSAPSKSDKVTFVWGRSGDAVRLDPALVTDGESVQVITNVFDTLVSFKPGTTELVPWLATSWEASDDGLVWTFHLRQGVKFHDGSALDAEAVVFSFERQSDAGHPAHREEDDFAYYKTNFKALEKVEAVDAHTLRFTLSQPYAPFLAALALFNCSIVSPTAFASEGTDERGKYRYDFSSNPVGSGPFVFKSWQRDSRIVLNANPDHFAGAPKIDRLIFKPIKNAHTRLKELQSGTIQGMDNPNLRDLERAGDMPGLRVVTKPGINVCYLAMNTEKPPFNDVRVRQAVAYAIDKRSLIESAYDGKAEPAVSMCPASMAGHLALEDYEPHGEMARKQLELGGVKPGLEVELWYPVIQRTYLPDSSATAIQIQQDLKAVGIDAKLRKVEWAAYLSGTANGEHDLCILGWMADIFDPDNFLYVLLDKDNAVKPAENRSFYKGEEVHRLLIEAQRTSDWAKREKLYHEAQRILHRDVPVIPLATVPDYRVLRDNVEGYEIYPAGGEYFRHVSIRPGP
jgi:peptide/nickel transport system substrate-binding protein